MALLGYTGFLLLFAASAVPAQQVFKCVEGDAVSYQSMPCAGMAEKSWEVAPSVAAPVTSRPRVDVERRGATNAGARNRQRQWRAPVSARSSPRDACEKAKAGREAAYRKAGLKRDFKLSSHWDNRVHDACW
ncbi:MAG: hypothetical protein WA956_05000 [Stenotrophomonas sp.]